MDIKLRTAMPTRITALGFIVLILGGNAWFAYYILGAKEPDLIRHLFMLGLVLTTLGGLGMLGWKIQRILFPPTSDVLDIHEEEK